MFSFLTLNSLLGIGSIIFAVAYSFERFRSGSKQANSDLITTLTDQVKAQNELIMGYKNQMIDMQSQLLNLTQEVGKLKGINESNDKKMQEYLQIIANRNPELEQTLVQLEELIRKVVPFMGDVAKWHDDIKTRENTSIELLKSIVGKDTTIVKKAYHKNKI